LVTESFSSSGGKVTVMFPNSDVRYDVFVIANAGGVRAPSSKSELLSLTLDCPDLADMSTGGIPMVGSLRSHLPSATANVKVKMLCSQIKLSYETSAKTADYTITSVRLRNCARAVRPFADASAAGETVSFGDSLTTDEISGLKNGSEVCLYALENMQGVLLPFNDDPFQKIPTNLPSADLASRCTYLEVVADVRTEAAVFTGVHFRTYLGADITSDFNLVRSRNYKYSIDFDSNMIREEEWRIDPSTPVIAGDLKVSKTEARVINGITDTVFVSTVSANDKELEFEITIDGSKVDNAGLKMVVKDMVKDGLRVKALVFSTDCPIDGLNDYNKEPDVKLYRVGLRSRETFGGSPLLSADIDVKVYHEVFPIYLKTTPSAMGCKMYAYSNNPVSIPFSGSVLVRQGQSLTGTTRYFNSVMPGRGGALLGEIPCYEDGMAIFLTMKPQIAGFARDMYMGDYSREYFGPGTDHSPGNMAKYPGNAAYTIEYTQTTDAESRNYCARLSCSSGYLFKLDNTTTGWNCQDNYNLNEFIGRPFYFVNGGLQLYVVGKNEDPARYLDDSGRVGFVAFAFEPGRDLCLESRYGTKGYCTFGAKLGVMTQFWGNVHRWMEWREYQYGVYLSINGCSCWAGATKGPSGYVIK